jgi:predicted metalloprotease with PDZ domain
MDAVSAIAGKNMDDFFTKYITGTAVIPYSEYFEKVGLSMVNTNEKQPINYIGAITNFNSNRLTTANVERNSPAWNAGLSVNDELIAIDQYRLGDDLNRFLSMKKPGDKVTFTISRSNFIKTIDVIVAKSPSVRYVFEQNPKATETQKAMYKIWMHL